MVVVSHSFALTGTPFEPFSNWTGYDSGGGIGVAIFFVISGYLVSGSVERRSTADYLASRALRIMPALALVTCFEVLVIGPAFTTLSLPAYFSNIATWGHLANPLIYGINFWLPGTFKNLPNIAVNGSLWTLPIECGLYLLLPAMAFCGGITKRGTAIAFAACCAAYFIATSWFGLTTQKQGPEVLRGVETLSAVKLTTFFFAGAALRAYRDDISLNAGGAIICCALLYAAAWTPVAMAVYFACLPYLVIFIAFRPPAISLERIGDLSYGIYLFAFPVQQSLITMFHLDQRPIRLLELAIPVVVSLAFLSWRYVEAPALRLRSRKTATIIPMSAAAA
jgi:peptidoglycan/LPS O-acetylase OafA/YrhL